MFSFLASRVSLLPEKFGKEVNQTPHPSEIDSQFDYSAYFAKWLVIQPPTSCDFVRFPKFPLQHVGFPVNPTLRPGFSSHQQKRPRVVAVVH